MAGAHIVGQAGESQATPDIPPEVDDEALAALLLEIMNRGIQCAPKSHPHGTGKVRDLEKSDFRPHLRLFDDFNPRPGNSPVAGSSVGDKVTFFSASGE